MGEAALSPSAYSLITDYFPKEKLGTAISVYSMGIYIGAGMSYLLGGIVVRFASAQEAWILPLVGAVRPWQVIFLAVGLPGILVAPLVYSIREPLRRGIVRQASLVPAAHAFAYMLENKRTLLCHTFGFGLLSLTSYASGAWVPEFFRRNYHWDIPHTGIVYGSLVIIFGSIGIVGAGKIADLLRARGIPQANMLVGMLVALIAIPVSCLLYLAPSAGWATLWLAPGCLLAAAPFGIAAAAIQQMMPNPMRGQASAVYLFIINMIGLGLGPTAVAVCTQYLFRRDDAVNYSLLVVHAERGSLRRNRANPGFHIAGSGSQPLQRGSVFPYRGCGRLREAVLVRHHGPSAQTRDCQDRPGIGRHGSVGTPRRCGFANSWLAPAQLRDRRHRNQRPCRGSF